jgi:cytosine deaminase
MRRYLNANVPACSLGLNLTGPVDPESPSVLCDITVEGGVIKSVTRTASAQGLSSAGDTDIDLQGMIVLPGFLDAHTHLDKTHTWDRSPNRTRTFPDAIDTLFQDEANWTEEDMYRRASYALRCAHANGTVALRTHFNCPAGVLREPYSFFQSLAGEWRDQLTLQYVPLCTTEGYATPVEEAYFRKAKEAGCAAVGGMPLMNPNLRGQLDRMFELAAAHEIGLDLHIDENPFPESETLREIARGVLRHEFPFPVTCGHCCSLARQDPERQADTLNLVAHARLNLIPLPMCNLFLMDRRWDSEGAPLSPYWRGTTLALEAINLGINVAVASDNVRDAFYAYGDYDMLEVWNQANRILHLDSRLGSSIEAVTSAPALLMGLDSQVGTIAPGKAARLIAIEAPSMNQLLSRSGCRRHVITGEQMRSIPLPEWTELEEA